MGVKVLHILEQGLGSRYKACAVFEKAASMKLLGKKGGKGFYIHGKTRVVNPELAASSGNIKSYDDGEIVRRMVFMMINEAALCLEEKVVDSADTVDCGMIMGTGFPPFKGGLLRYADSVGIDTVIGALNNFETYFKDGRFKPCAYLLNLQKQGKKFYN